MGTVAEVSESKRERGAKHGAREGLLEASQGWKHHRVGCCARPTRARQRKRAYLFSKIKGLGFGGFGVWFGV